MFRILILSIGLLFAGELEVDGVIKANSGIDANNNPITNVGSPLTMSDAINGNVLQEALRDDSVYEFKIVIYLGFSTTLGQTYYVVYDEGHNTQQWDFTSYLNTLSQEGWSYLT